MNGSVLAGGLLHLWNECEVQILVLLSFTLQVSLLMFAGTRRHNISRLLRILLWLLYQLADLTATYTIGHMSLSCKPSEHRHLMAFWAPFLLIHLGGQDCISAYAMEDNQLWLRHLLTLAVQALGAAYVLYKYIAPSETLLITAAVLLFAVGIIKYGERVWALKSSNLDSIIDRANIEEVGPSNAGWSTRQLVDKNGLNAEMVLQGAHDMLYICVCQFVDYPVFRHKLQHDTLGLFYDRRIIYEFIEFQLSLMYDIFYTKAMVIHTWYGRCLRVVTFLATLGSLFLFHFSAGKHGGYKGVDAIVTYILLVGASILEIASVLKATFSTWTCSLLRARRCSELHLWLLSLRLRFRAALSKRWSGSIGQHNLIKYCTSVTSLRSMVVSLWEDGSTVISTSTKELVLKEIFRMVGSCQGEEEVMWSYRGQCILRLCDEPFLDLKWSTGIEFDESILIWHFATNIFLFFLWEEEDPGYKNNLGIITLVNAINALSNYMMFLLVERPYMLPSPVRHRLHTSTLEELRRRFPSMSIWNRRMKQIRSNHDYTNFPPILARGATLGNELLNGNRSRPNGNRSSPVVVLKMVFGVWVEMMCYAAHHCSRESHARQLNCGGGEFLTVVWLLSATAFHRVYFDDKRSELADVQSFYMSRKRRRTNGTTVA